MSWHTLSDHSNGCSIAFGEYKQTAGPSTAPLAMRLREASLRMTIFMFFNYLASGIYRYAVVSCFYSQQWRVLVREGEDAGERDANPGGAVVEFVEELVERFLEQIGGEAELSLLRARDEGWICGVDGELVGAEELG
jgi:hypothetical protein